MKISDLPRIILYSLIITIIIECLIGLIFGFRKKDLLNIFLVNILTNPLLNAITGSVNYYFGLKVRTIVLIILEIIVVITEGYIYQKYFERRKINPYIVSLILNISSFGLGMIINNFIY